MDEPQFGYGKDGRPLCSPRDRDAEAIRRLLCNGTFKDAGERHPDGFVVEGADASEDGDEPFRVVYRGTTKVAATLDIYTLLLEDAGLSVAADPADDNVLLVQRPPAPPPNPRGLLIAVHVAMVLYLTASLVSWIAFGQVEVISGIGASVLFPLWCSS